MTKTPAVDSQRKVSQGAFWTDVLVFHQTLVTKLHEVRRTDLIGRMDACHTDELVLTCKGCCRTKIVSNRCEKRWCPICVPRLARERREALEFWTATLRQPKHVVLTQRNSIELTRSTVKTFTNNLRRLRNQKFCKGWRSGTWAIEVTNESRGWHLHAHLLVDADWIDAKELSLKWGKLVHQDYAIVKVKDARKADYLRELLKYVVKSSQLASWPAKEIAAFMDAFTRIRTFGVFGSLTGQRGEWKKFLRENRRLRATCECGCCDYNVEDYRVWQLNPEDRARLRSRRA